MADITGNGARNMLRRAIWRLMDSTLFPPDVFGKSHSEGRAYAIYTTISQQTYGRRD